jgi:YD repeat-containing protein
MMFKTLRNFLCYFFVYFLTCFILIDPAISGDSDNKEIPLNQYGIRSTNPYVVDRFIENGKLIDMVIVPGRPNPPGGVSMQVAVVPEPDIAAGTNTLSNVPALTWCFGCAATSAAMMFGYYDNSGYHNMYAGPTNGGVFPMTNVTWGTAVINGETRALCPLSATRMGLDGRTTKGHVDDYWIKYGSSALDPFIGNWPEHTHGECTGDYMGTNQSSFGNSDGSTTFFFYSNGVPLYDFTLYEPSHRDGCHGLKLFIESRGYNVETNFSQYIYGYDGNTQGFTFEDFKNEIGAGRPVLIHLAGHTVLGYGYNDTGSIVYIHDTWDYSDHSMIWGGSYSDMQHTGVTVLRLAEFAPPVPYLVTNSVNCTHSWQDVNLSDSYIALVVIVGPTSYHGTDPGVVRLQNVTGNSFDVRFQEWLYKDGSHTQENIPYLVISDGRHQMPDGSIWEAGTFSLSGTGAWTAQSFSGSFPSTPALFLTAQTYGRSCNRRGGIPCCL